MIFKETGLHWLPCSTEWRSVLVCEDEWVGTGVKFVCVRVGAIQCGNKKLPIS